MEIFHSYVSLPEGTGIFPLECILDPNSFWPSILYITSNYITTIYHHCIPIIIPLYHHYILFFSVGYIPLTHYITTDSLYIPVYSHYIPIILPLYTVFFGWLHTINPLYHH